MADGKAIDKIALRKQARRVRADLAKALPDFAFRIAEGALALPRTAIVAGYVPIASEADPSELMAHLGARGHRLALPCIVAADKPLRFRRWREGEPLTDGPFGTSEPRREATAVTPAVLLVPLLAFDAAGGRLGYGGGYYDRTLAVLRAAGDVLAFGIAFAGQEVNAVPCDADDQRLDGIVTERGVRRFG